MADITAYIEVAPTGNQGNVALVLDALSYAMYDLTSSSGAAPVTGPMVLQRVFDTVDGGFVSWETEGSDTAGTYYPGAGTWGVHTSNYTILSVTE